MFGGRPNGITAKVAKTHCGNNGLCFPFNKANGGIHIPMKHFF